MCAIQFDRKTLVSTIEINLFPHFYSRENANSYIQTVKPIALVSSFFLLLCIGSCSLNADQEANLNSAMNDYLDARNNNRVKTEVRLTYPDAVRFYKKQGDKAFIEHFLPENNQVHFRDGVIQEVEQDDNTIHVRYEYHVYFEAKDEVVHDKKDLYAVSFDGGKGWKFMDGFDYENPEIMPLKKKLIKLK